MGFDQYHEPPEELPRRDSHLCPAVRVADRGGRGDRLVRAAARGRDRTPRPPRSCATQSGEEFKHFSMDLEALMRRTPIWREIAQGILFKTGDIVEHGEAAEAEASGEEPLRGTTAAARWESAA